MRLQDIHNISIKWKLIIPFLFLALLGTFFLIFLSIRFQERTFLSQEKEHLECLQKSFSNKISESSSLALTLAKEASLNTCLRKALAKSDLRMLKTLCAQSHHVIRGCLKSLGWKFILLDANGKLVKLPNGEKLRISENILNKWTSRRRSLSGIALINNSLLIWGAAQVFHENRRVGSIFVIIPVDKNFLMSFTSIFKVHYTIFTYDEKSKLPVILASTQPYKTFKNKIYDNFDESQLPYFHLSPRGPGHQAMLITSIKDFKGHRAAFLEIAADRTHSLQLLSEYKKNMVIVGTAGFLLSLGIILWITIIFTRPIGKLVRLAQEITAGKRIKEIKLKHRDEIGILAESLNEMLMSLERSHRQIRDYAENLEKKVRDRTRALTISEEKYRTLVENVPLVVYRTDSAGSLTFINRYIEDLLGFPAEEIIKKKDFLLNRIVDEDRDLYLKHWKKCLENAEEFEIEYRMLDRYNQVLIVVDHAIPEVGKDGKVKSVDGIIVDVTERRKAQEKILQAEELKALREISARLAHEIRNPLTVAGGFARQLLKNTPEEDPAHKKLEIITTEIERLENILRTTLEYIKPRVLIFKKTDLNALISPILGSYKERFRKVGINIEIDLDPSIPYLNLDPELFNQIVKNILDLIITILPGGSVLRILTYLENNYVILAFRIEDAEIKMEKFEPLVSPFSPTLEKGLPLSLPLTKIIIEKHNGLLKIEKLAKKRYSITISLPISRDISKTENED